MHQSHAPRTLVAAALLLLVHAPLARAADAGDVASAASSSRSALQSLRAQTLPSDSTALTTALTTLRDELRDANSELSDLAFSGVTDGEALQALVQGEALLADGWETLEYYELQLGSSQQEAYDSGSAAVVSELKKLSNGLRDTLRPRVAPTCALSFIGTSAEAHEARGEALDEIASSLSLSVTAAGVARNSYDVAILQRQVERSGALAEAIVLSQWRLSNDAQDELRSSVDDVTRRFSDIQSKVNTALGSGGSGVPSLTSTISTWSARLGDDLTAVEDSDSEQLGSSDWENQRSDIVDRAKDQLVALEDRADAARTPASNATSVADVLAARREVAVAEQQAWWLVSWARLPLSTSDERALTRSLRAVDDAAKEVSSTLANRGPSSATRLTSETKERIAQARSESLPSTLSGTFDAGRVDQFNDLPSDVYLRNPMAQMIAVGQLRGREDGRAMPYLAVTRREFLKLLLGSVCIDPGVRSSEDARAELLQDYDDIEATSGASLEDGNIATAVARGIARGQGGRIFAPNRPVTRFEAAKMLLRVYELPTASSGVTSDAATEEQRVVMNGAVAAGLFSGQQICRHDPGAIDLVCRTVLRPNDLLTRAEATKIIMGAVIRRGYQQTTAGDAPLQFPHDFWKATLLLPQVG